MKEPIYLDHAATTPVAKEVFEEMAPYFRETYGNASSRSHGFGWQAKHAVDVARSRIADLLNAPPSTLTFTSGSTEGINLAIKGYVSRHKELGKHIICSSVEHMAVLDVVRALEKEGFGVSYIDPTPTGTITSDAVRMALQADTILAIVMFANNETGVINPIAEIQALCTKKGVKLFTDATQAVGKIPVDVTGLKLDMLACSAHKIYGPKGVGAIYVSENVRLHPVFHGGGHQSGLRPGTLNVPGIVGFGAAAHLARREMKTQAERCSHLRTFLERELSEALIECLINGELAKRLPFITNLTFRFTEAEALLSTFQRKLALSTGSACSSADLEPSHVLLAMGLAVEDAKASVRISLGRDTTKKQLEQACKLLIAGVQALRKESPLWELYQDGVIS